MKQDKGWKLWLQGYNQVNLNKGQLDSRPGRGLRE